MGIKRRYIGENAKEIETMTFIKNRPENERLTGRAKRTSFSDEECRKFIWKRKFRAFRDMSSLIFLLFFLLIVADIVSGSFTLADLIMLFLPFIPSLYLVISLRPGTSDFREIIKRWKKYEELFTAAETEGCDPVITIREICKRTKVTEQQIINDIAWMIDLGLISERWYDEKAETLYLPNLSPEEYDEWFHERYEEKNKECVDVETHADKEKEPGSNDQAIDLDDYVEKIGKLNSRICSEEMSDKLSALEKTVSGIMIYAKNHPENGYQARKLADCYLPTVIRLITSYAELEEQQIKTEKTEKIQKEIERSVDTMNEAFTNMFTQILENTETDISSDISVITTKAMLDGLLAGEAEVLQQHA